MVSFDGPYFDEIYYTYIFINFEYNFTYVLWYYDIKYEIFFKNIKNDLYGDLKRSYWSQIFEFFFHQGPIPPIYLKSGIIHNSRNFKFSLYVLC